MSYFYKGALVITCSNIDKTKDFLEGNFGLKFKKEQHGNGPEHYSCSQNGQVLEIYPFKET